MSQEEAKETTPPSQREAAPPPEAYHYPEQRHAGAVGLGPEYGKGVHTGGGDVLAGWKEELVGKITHNPEKFKHGHDVRTGELKKKEHEKDEEENPFEKGKKSQPTNTPPGLGKESSEGLASPKADSHVDKDKAAKEQAATTTAFEARGPNVR